MRRRTVAPAVIVLALLARAAAGQARMEGIAQSGSAFLTGVDAVNPALLASSEGVSVRLLGLAASAANNTFSLTDYNAYNGAHLTRSEKDEILGKIDGSLEGHSDLLVEAPSFSIGSFAFTSLARGGIIGAFPKAVFEVLLSGNTPGRDYRFDTADGSAVAIGEARLSHGRRIELGPSLGAIDVGIAFKILYGGAYARIEEAHGSLRTDPDRVQGEGLFRARTALGGTGFGFDLGARRDMGGGWSAALGLKDVGSSVHWTRRTREEDVRFDVANGSIHSLDDGGDLLDENRETRDIGPFRTTIPIVMTLGVAHSAGKAALAADWEQGFAESSLTDSSPRVAAGAEYRLLSYLDARAGLSVGGRAGKSVACGCGLRAGPLRFDLALATCGRFLPGGGRGISGGLSFGIDRGVRQPSAGPRGEEEGVSEGRPGR